MSNPSFVIRLGDRTRKGGLRTSHLVQIQTMLEQRKFILLPSDTCYSIAALPRDEQMYDDINNLLNRKDMPLSLAFPSIQKVGDWAELTTLSASLLERFTPGPITVVCKAKERFRKNFTPYVIRSSDKTLGVRIPDSLIEREVAASTKYNIVTTVAVRNLKNDNAIQDFEQAIEIVSKGMKKIGYPEWGAIEGGDFYAAHSTVVRIIEGRKQIELIREGDIPFDEIKQIVKNTPFWAIKRNF